MICMLTAVSNGADPKMSDQRTILRAWAINDFDSSVRLYVQVVR